MHPVAPDNAHASLSAVPNEVYPYQNPVAAPTRLGSYPYQNPVPDGVQPLPKPRTYWRINLAEKPTGQHGIIAMPPLLSYPSSPKYARHPYIG